MTPLPPPSSNEIGTAFRARVIVAFLLVYVIWGSTYLAIRFAVETLPPLLMAGLRFTTAGALLYAFARWRGAPRPSASHWRWATLIGGLLLLGGNGAVVSVAHILPSGLSSLLVATVPFWMAGLDWLIGSGRRPSFRVVCGLGVGFVGLAILLGPGKFADTSHAHAVGAMVLVLGAFSWAVGSILSYRAPHTGSSLLDIAMKQIAGGALLLIAGLSTGEVGSVDLASVSPSSVIAFLYLIVFGSLVGFSAYLWLLQVSSPARVSTYAYVNPVIAVFLGWLLGGEQPTALTLLGSAVILFAVAIVTTARTEAPPADRPLEPASTADSGEVPAKVPVPAAVDTR